MPHEPIAVADLATARRILAQLETEQIGAAVLQIPNFKSPISNPGTLPAGLRPATDALVAPDPAHPAAARRCRAARIH